MKTFIVKTENFVAHCIACKALKAIDNGAETVHNLYKKAAMKNGKIVITSLTELALWKAALEGYKPNNPAESKVYKVLRSCAERAVEKRTDAALSSVAA